MTRTAAWRPVPLLAALITAGVILAGCEALAPLREPPGLSAADPTGGATTRDEAAARLGPPDEVRASDQGVVLVYRRRVTVDANPGRLYGLGTDRLERYERVLLYLDGEGRIVRSAIEPE